MYILDFILQSQGPVLKIDCLLFTISLAQVSTNSRSLDIKCSYIC